MPTLSDIGEDALVKSFTTGLTLDESVLVPAGDDCAVVAALAEPWVQLLKTDVIVEDVHFTRDMPAALVGRKALARAVSDIAAMGGKPQHALVTLILPSWLEFQWVEAMQGGLRQLADAHGINIVGGETSRGAQIVISIALTGIAPRDRVLLRSAGKVGDAILVTGELGGSFANHHHLTFEPRLEAAQWLAKHTEVRAMMDLSDGLGADLPRLFKASGVGFSLDESALPCSPGCTPLQAWSDGEDYELLFTLPDDQVPAVLNAWARDFPDLKLTKIGKLVEASAAVAPSFALPGWDHFGNGKVSSA